MRLSPAIILDRDGTLHPDKGYLHRFEDFEPIPGVAEALNLLRAKGFRLFGATNQGGVARGLYGVEAVESVNASIRGYYRERGADIEEIAFCPHHPEGTVPPFARECECRKPKPGLLLDLARRYGLDLARSYMVGDHPRDAEAGLAAGAAGILIREKSGSEKVDNGNRIKEFDSLLSFAASLDAGEPMQAVSMDQNTKPDPYRILPQEMEALWKCWNAQEKEILSISQHLLPFLARHRDEILTQTGSRRDPEALVNAAKGVVCKYGTVNFALDMADQVRAINDDIWYHGEQGDFNREKIKEEWPIKYGQPWRVWRVKAILFILDRRASEVAAALSA